MRLINVHTLELEAFHESERPPYACLSHRWSKDTDEVSFQEYAQRNEHAIRSRPGYEKILNAAKAVSSGELSHDHSTSDLSYIWVDTCCIDRNSSAELSEAINSMWKWYKDSKVCLVYLADVCDTSNGEGGLNESSQPFRGSRWFRRAWTLQELLAPETVDFYNQSWQYLGSKSQWAAEISTITGIDEDAVVRYHQNRGRLGRGWLSDEKNYTVAEKMCWAAGRESTRTEDRAYSLLGLFDLNLPLLYGEGERAFVRLQEEILRRGDDLSLLDFDRYVAVSASDGENDSWPKPGMSNLLPWTPDAFRPSKYHFSRKWQQVSSRVSVVPCSLTNTGLNLDILTMPWSPGIYVGLIPLNYVREEVDHNRKRSGFSQGFSRAQRVCRFREYSVLPLVTQDHLVEPNTRSGRHMYICTDQRLFAQQQAYLAKYDAGIGKDEHNDWWDQSTIKQDILLLPKCHTEWQDPGIVNGISIYVDHGDVTSEHKWFERTELPYFELPTLNLKPGPEMYLKPVGRWTLDHAEGDASVEFGFDMYQEFVCAFVHQEELASTHLSGNLKLASSLTNFLWSGSFADWQDRGKYSYGREVHQVIHNGRPMRVETHMYKSNHHYDFITDKHLGKVVVCSLRSYAYHKKRRYLWYLQGRTASEVSYEL